MSIKIYSGLLYNGKLIDCYRTLHSYRPTVKQMVIDKYVRFLARSSEEIIDLKALGNAKPAPVEGSYPLSVAMRRWDERRKVSDEQGTRDPAVDTRLEFSLYPISDRRVLMIPWVDDPDWSAWIEQLPEVREYGYWDNTDRPDSVSQAAWRKRKREWDLACLKNDTFKDSGLSIDLTPGYEPKIYLFSDPKKRIADFVAEKCLPKDQRAVKYAKNLVRTNYATKLKEEPKDTSKSEITRLIDYTVSPQFVTDVEQEVGRIVAALDDITPDMLNQKFS